LAKVRERGLYAGEQGDLGLWRVTDFAPAADVFAAINSLVSESVLEQLSTPPTEGEEEFALWRDPQSRELWLARARAGGPWVSTDGDRLVVDLPISPEGAAPALRQIVQESEDEEIRWFLAKVWRTEITAGGVRLWLGTADGPTLHFGGGPWADGYPAQVDADLLQAAREAGLSIATADSIRSLRERYGLPSPKLPEGGAIQFAVVAPRGREGLEIVELRRWGAPEEPPLAVVKPFQRFRVKRAVACRDLVDQPAISIELESDDAAAFTAFTGQHVGERVAIIVGGKFVSAPKIHEPLQGWSILSGDFSEAVRDEVLAHLRSR
jgi:hypothetical protein